MEFHDCEENALCYSVPIRRGDGGMDYVPMSWVSGTEKEVKL